MCFYDTCSPHEFLKYAQSMPQHFPFMVQKGFRLAEVKDLGIKPKQCWRGSDAALFHETAQEGVSAYYGTIKGSVREGNNSGIFSLNIK